MFSGSVNLRVGNPMDLKITWFEHLKFALMVIPEIAYYNPTNPHIKRTERGNQR